MALCLRGRLAPLNNHSARILRAKAGSLETMTPKPTPPWVSSVLNSNVNPFSTVIPQTRPIIEPTSRKGPILRQPHAYYSTLPNFPVAPLKQTLERYLRTAKAVVSEQDYKETEQLVKEFASGEGEELQALLQTRADQKDNWLSDWWLNLAYLEFRAPLPINSSPGVLLPKQNFSGIVGQLDFASRVVAALLEYKRIIDHNEIPIDRAGNALMDMSQYPLLFGTCRIPGEPHDTMRYGSHEIKPAQHIVVARRGLMYRVCVYDVESGRALGEEQLHAQLKAVVAAADAQPAGSNAGLATSEERGVWARLYKRVKANPTNAASLEAIERALFLVCLDGPSQPLSGTRSVADEAARQMLHGGGSRYNSANRWFDKTMQFIIGENGSCGMTYEHSPAEGPPVASLMDYVTEKITENKKTHDAAVKCDVEPPKLLPIALSDEDKTVLSAAAKRIDHVAEDVEVKMVTFDKFGKNFPKSQKLSPDSFLQLAFQLTYFKLHQSHPPTYETGTLRRFKLGRTDTIRLPSLESVAFVDGMRDRAQSHSNRAKLLRNAADYHKHYTAAVMSGNAIDRHLLGLKLIAIEHGKNVPRLFDDSTYDRLMHFQLSTSQVPTKHTIVMCFGPMYPDCYGICYNPHEEVLNMSVSAYRSCKHTSALRFATTLEESLMEMKETLEAAGSKSKL